MATRRVATVFGGSGFIGRYVVKRLAQQGYIVRVAVRDPEAALFLKPMGAVGQIVPLYASVMNEGTVHRAVERGRCRGQPGWRADGEPQRPRSRRCIPRGRADRAGCPRPTASAGWCTMSAIGADPASPSRYASTKGEGESRPCWRRSRGHASCVRRWCSAWRTSSSTASPRSPDICPVHAGDLRRHARCSRCSSATSPMRSMAALIVRRLDGPGLRTRRPTGLDIPRNPGVHPEADPPRTSGWWTSRWGSRGCRPPSCSTCRASH